MAKITFPDAVLKLRAHLKISREELAVAADVTASAVSWWETGKRTPNAMHRERLVTYARERKAPENILVALAPPPRSEARAT